MIYARPELAASGFLTQYINDDRVKSWHSILDKPDFLFSGEKMYNDLIKHPLFTSQKKAFHSYEQALIFFANEAIGHGLNEANLSVALYYFALGKRDSVNKYLDAYLTNGNCLFGSFAASIRSHGKPFARPGKTLVLYNNIGHYSRGDYNYYLALRRKKYNQGIRNTLTGQPDKADIVFTNEYFGNSPRELNELHKLIYGAVFLYTENDISLCKKRRLRSGYPNENEVLPAKFRKSFYVFAPETYEMLQARGYDALFLVDIVYEYEDYMIEDEIFNTYTGYFLSINSERPYFKDASRIGLHRRQTEAQIAHDLHEFLYE